MWSYLSIISTFIAIAVGNEIVLEGPEGIQRIVSSNVKSVDYKLVYGNEDMSVINEVVNDVEKHSGLNKVHLNDVIQPLPAQDVKCLMSVDRYCSKEMGDLKKVIIQAIKEDCAKCTKEEKDKAGKVIASMLAHDNVAWKLFLTRSALLIMKREERKKLTDLKFKQVGEPEEVLRPPGNSYQMPGAKVRVRRYASVLVE